MVEGARSGAALIARANLPARVFENGREGYRHAARRPLIVQPVIPRLVNRVDADRLRLWRAVIVMYAVDGVNDVFVAHALKVNPDYAVALHEVFGARDVEFVGAVQRVGVRRVAHREPPQIVAPAVKAGKADTSN